LLLQLEVVAALAESLFVPELIVVSKVGKSGNVY
jgi:hypothetical protein